MTPAEEAKGTESMEEDGEEDSPSTPPVVKEVAEGDKDVNPSKGSIGDIKMEEATAAKAAAAKENDTERIAALYGRQGQRAPTDVDLTKSDEEDSGEEEDNEDDGLAGSA